MEDEALPKVKDTVYEYCAPKMKACLQLMPFDRVAVVWRSRCFIIHEILFSAREMTLNNYACQSGMALIESGSLVRMGKIADDWIGRASGWLFSNFRRSTLLQFKRGTENHNSLLVRATRGKCVQLPDGEECRPSCCNMCGTSHHFW